MAAHDWVMFKRQHNYKDTDVENTEYQIGGNAEGIILYNFRTGVPEIATIGGRVLGAAIEDDLILGGQGLGHPHQRRRVTRRVRKYISKSVQPKAQRSTTIQRRWRNGTRISAEPIRS